MRSQDVVWGWPGVGLGFGSLGLSLVNLAGSGTGLVSRLRSRVRDVGEM
jgi:hypothetical protein